MRSSRQHGSGDKDKKASVPIVDSLLTALSLLDHFSINEPELSLSQLSEKSGLYKSRVHRLCGTAISQHLKAYGGPLRARARQ